MNPWQMGGGPGGGLANPGNKVDPLTLMGNIMGAMMGGGGGGANTAMNQLAAGMAMANAMNDNRGSRGGYDDYDRDRRQVRYT